MWTFSVLNAPDSPQSLSPNNGAAGQSVTPTLIWQNAPTAESYRLQISKDLSFTEVIHDQNGLTKNEYTLPNGLLNNNTQYFWRVNASNAGGTSSMAANTWNLWNRICQSASGTCTDLAAKRRFGAIINPNPGPE